MNDLINYLTEYFNKHGKLPSIKEISTKIKRPEDVTIQILEKLKKQGKLGFYDGSYYIPNLSNSNNTAKTQKTIEKQPIKKDNITPSTASKVNFISRIFNAINKFLFNQELNEKISENIIKIVLLVVSVFCMIVSSKNTYEYFLNYLTNPYCMLASISIVIFSVFAFQAAMLLGKKGNKFFASLLFISGIIALCICMISTIHTQYKNNKIVETANVQIKANKNLKLLEDSEKELTTNIAQVNNQINSNQKRLDALMNQSVLSKEEQQEYKNLNYNNSLLRNRLETYNNKLTPIREELQKIYDNDDVVINSSTSQNDFYSSLGNIFIGMDSQRIAILLYTLFAIFMDIMAPLGVAVFLGHFKHKDANNPGFIKMFLNKIFKLNNKDK